MTRTVTRYCSAEACCCLMRCCSWGGLGGERAHTQGSQLLEGLTAVIDYTPNPLQPPSSTCAHAWRGVLGLRWRGTQCHQPAMDAASCCPAAAADWTAPRSLSPRELPARSPAAVECCCCPYVWFGLQRSHVEGWCCSESHRNHGTRSCDLRSWPSLTKLSAARRSLGICFNADWLRMERTRAPRPTPEPSTTHC